MWAHNLKLTPFHSDLSPIFLQRLQRSDCSISRVVERWPVISCLFPDVVMEQRRCLFCSWARLIAKSQLTSLRLCTSWEATSHEYFTFERLQALFFVFFSCQSFMKFLQNFGNFANLTAIDHHAFDSLLCTEKEVSWFLVDARFTSGYICDSWNSQEWTYSTCLMLLVHATVMQSSMEESTLYSCVKSIKATVQTFYALFVYLQL